MVHANEKFKMIWMMRPSEISTHFSCSLWLLSYFGFWGINRLWQLLLIWTGLVACTMQTKVNGFHPRFAKRKVMPLNQFRVWNNFMKIFTQKYTWQCYCAVYDGVWRRHDNVSFSFWELFFWEFESFFGSIQIFVIQKFVHFWVKLIASLIQWCLWISLCLYACILYVFAFRLPMHWSFHSAKGVWDLIQWLIIA